MVDDVLVVNIQPIDLERLIRWALEEYTYEDGEAAKAFNKRVSEALSQVITPATIISGRWSLGENIWWNELGKGRKLRTWSQWLYESDCKRLQKLIQPTEWILDQPSNTSLGYDVKMTFLSTLQEYFYSFLSDEFCDDAEKLLALERVFLREKNDPTFLIEKAADISRTLFGREIPRDTTLKSRRQMYGAAEILKPRASRVVRSELQAEVERLAERVFGRNQLKSSNLKEQLEEFILMNHTRGAGATIAAGYLKKRLEIVEQGN